MAITFLTGIPRSGKTYYAMFLLYMKFIFVKPVTAFTQLMDKYFPKKPARTYEVAYTNINQFDFSKSPKIKPFDYLAVYPELEILCLMYLDKKTDDELIEYAKSVNLYNCLFVIDECQNFFSKEDKVLTWWFTYHGHLYHDLILITQNLDLIHTSYAKLGEFFYKAVPPSSRLFSNKFRYVQFNSAKLFQKDKVGDFHVPMIKEIFDMYVSGASNNAKSHVKKYLAYALVLIIILIFAFKQFLSLFDTSVSDTNTTKTDTNQTTLIPVAAIEHKPIVKDTAKVQRDTTHDLLFVIHCVDMICTYKDTDFPKPLFNKLTQKTAPEFIWFFQSANYTQYFVMLPADTFDFLQIEEKKEKDATSKTTKTPNAITAITSHK